MADALTINGTAWPISRHSERSMPLGQARPSFTGKMLTSTTALRSHRTVHSFTTSQLTRDDARTLRGVLTTPGPKEVSGVVFAEATDVIVVGEIDGSEEGGSVAGRVVLSFELAEEEP